MQKPSLEKEPSPPIPAMNIEVETAKCSACGFTEECTPVYIRKVRERYHGRWLCGLCIEAVKDEVLRSEELITIEEALNRHIKFSQGFRKFIPNHDAEGFSFNRSMSRQSIDVPSNLLLNSATSSHKRADELLASPASIKASRLARSETCFSFISG